VIVLDKLSFEQPKTKDMISILKALKADGSKVLVMSIDNGDNVGLSARNIAKVKPISPNNINTFDILHYDKLLITEEAVRKVEEVLG